MPQLSTRSIVKQKQRQCTERCVVTAMMMSELSCYSTTFSKRQNRFQVDVLFDSMLGSVWYG
eukprot:scaffold3885_cov99-Amphora_coffeaeformis.AAC.2